MDRRILFALTVLLFAFASAKSNDLVLEDEVLKVWNREAVKVARDISTGATGSEPEPEDPETDEATTASVTSGVATTGSVVATTGSVVATTGSAGVASTTGAIVATTGKVFDPTFTFVLGVAVADFNETRFVQGLCTKYGIAAADCSVEACVKHTRIAATPKKRADSTYYSFQLTGPLQSSIGNLKELVDSGDFSSLDTGYTILQGYTDEEDSTEDPDNIVDENSSTKDKSKTVAIAVGVTVAVVVVVAVVVLVVVLATRKNKKNRVSPDQLH